MRHVILYEKDRTLIDRQTFAKLTGRSVHTIRLRCPVAEYRDGRALYDMDACEKILKDIPTRRVAA
jgi:hypothetical protein